MLDGIYWLRVDGADSSEEGVAVIRRGLVDGGGPVYGWQGRLVDEEGEVRGELCFRKWNQQAPPVLGMFKMAILGIEGRTGPGAFDLEAHGHGHHVIHLRVRGVRIGEPTDAASI